MNTLKIKVVKDEMICYFIDPEYEFGVSIELTEEEVARVRNAFIEFRDIQTLIYNKMEG